MFSHRVAIAVEPRLLADALQRALQRPGIDVVICVDEPSDTREERFDVAVVVDSLPPGVHADVVLRITDKAPPGRASVPTPDAEPAIVGDLPGLVAALDSLLRSDQLG